MTREEKVNLLNRLLEVEEKNDIGNLTRAERREFQQWVEALEQEPCEDAISRIQVVEWLQRASDDSIQHAIDSNLEFIPFVTPKLPEYKDAVSRKEVDRLCYRYLKVATDEHLAFYEDFLDLPSVMPARKEWIPVSERLPEEHEKVLVCGIEAINNSHVYAVKNWDVDTWRPLSAPSVKWLAWMPLPELYKADMESEE